MTPGTAVLSTSRLWPQREGAEVPLPRRRFDAVVIGGGLTGLVSGLLLAQEGADVLVCEARAVGAGASGATTAKSSLLQGTRLSELTSRHGLEAVGQYLRASRWGQGWLHDFCSRHGVPVQRTPAYTIALTEDGVEPVRTEHAAARSLGLSTELHTTLDTPFPVRAAVGLADQLQMDPSELLAGLVETAAVLLVGQGARAAWPEVSAFAERTGAGITTSLLGKPYVDEDHPSAAGTMGHLGTDASAHVLQGCDTLVIVGSNDPWTEFYPPPGAARAVQIDIDPAMLSNRYPVEVGVVGNAGPTLRALTARLRARGRTPWRDEVEATCKRWKETARLRSEVVADPLNPELAVREFGERLPTGVRLAVDVGSSVYHYVRQVTLPSDGRAHLSSTLASMGCGIPYGIAAKLEAPEAPVAVVAGDGGFQMLGINELVTVAHLHTQWADQRFVVLVLSNRDLSEVTWEQREMENHPRFAASQDVPRFDAAGYAELLGLTGLRADSPESLAQALDTAFTATTPVVIDATTDGDTPLLPPPPHVDAKIDGVRTALQAEGESGAHALGLLDEYIAITDRS